MLQRLPTVCLIDDDTEYGEMFRQFLQSRNISLIVLHNLSPEVEPVILNMNVLILDLFLPGLDGVEVLRFLANQGYQGAIVLISGQDATVLHSACELAKVKGLRVIGAFTKPVQLSGLVNLLEENLRLEPPMQRPQMLWAPTADELRHALHLQEFCLFYQPKYWLHSGQICGFEALARWLHPVRGLLPPVTFLSAIEQHGLMSEFSEMVIHEGIRQLGRWNQLGLRTDLAVNVSAGTLEDIDQPAHLLSLCQQHAVDPAQLTFEITETSVMNEAETALDILIRLRMKGFGLSIDDFGTGYSSLSQLHRIPFTELKIDRHFVQTLQDAESRAIVESCIMLAKRLGLTLVAEGVEIATQLEQLMQLGCDKGQGYFWAKPAPVADATHLLRQFAVPSGQRE
jgi:EAL domain-containing protein (putative c-di-GMP-specific phosphodiesterase class I)